MKRLLAILIVALMLLSSGCISDSGDDTPDRDGDGVQDKYDACPDIAGEPSNQGCPVTTPSPTTPADTPTETPPATTPADTPTETPSETPPATTPSDTTTLTPTYTWFTPTFVPLPTGIFTTTPSPWTTLTLTYTIPPGLFLMPWTGEWKSTSISKMGISQIWITYDTTYNLQLHYFSKRIFGGVLYKGHVTPTFEDGSLVGSLDFSDHTETISLTLNGDSMSVEWTYDPDDDDPTTYSSTLQKTDYVLPPANDGYFIDSYQGMFLDLSGGSYINSISLNSIEPNMLEASVYGRCLFTDCDWGEAEAYFYPGVVVFYYEDFYGTDRSLRITMSNGQFINAELTIYYSDGSSAEYDQTLSKLIPL